MDAKRNCCNSRIDEYHTATCPVRPLDWRCKECGHTWEVGTDCMLCGGAHDCSGPVEKTAADIVNNDRVEDVQEPQEDIVNKPSHYAKWVIEPITFIMRNGFEFWRGNIIKYASRAGSKLYEGMDEVESEITDLKKVIRYAEMRINQPEGETIL